MNKHLVYWISDFNGTTSGNYTEASKPNVMHFDDPVKAVQFQRRMVKLSEEGGTYRGRLVKHVSGVQHPPKPDLHILADNPPMSAVEKYQQSQERGQRNSKYTAESIIGKMARADHPITCLNPDEWFKVVKAQELSGRLAIIGENTCWFSIYLCDIKDPE